MKTGIYQIVNILDRKRYIGSALNITKRWNKHKSELNKNRHHAPHLQYAWNKYGSESFKFEILLICEKEELIEYEQLHFDELKPEYNVAKIAGSALGTKRTDEQRKRISERLKGHSVSEETKVKIRIGNQKKTISKEHKAIISAFHTGKKLSEETRAKMSAWQIGRVLSEETRTKMSITKKSKPSSCKRSPLTEETKAKISNTKKKNNCIKYILYHWGCAL